MSKSKKKTPMAVSYYDLNHFLAEADKVVEDLTKLELEDVLHYIGMERGYKQVEDVLHRPIHGNKLPWKGKRILGYERRDAEWMCNKTSLENVIHIQEDVEHKKDLIIMSYVPSTFELCLEKMKEAKNA